jgi:putative membrane protein
MRSPLTANDHQRIRDAANAIEHRTGSRIAIVITRVSDRYTLYTVAWAAVAAITAGGLGVAARPALSGRGVLFVELCILVAIALLMEVMPIRLAMVPARIKQASARNLAHREFAAHVIGGGPHRTRILVFVSLGERYVEIMADHATHVNTPEGTWNRVVDDFVAAVKADRIADGVVGAIDSCGTMLPSGPSEATARSSSS